MTAPVALVTGAGSGIGAACAAALARAGYLVHGASRTAPPVPDPAVRHHVMDVRSAAAVEGVVAGIVAAEGRIDLLVNCAGTSLVGAVEDTGDEALLAQIDTNLLGAWRVARAVLPAMRARGQGCIVNIGSIAGSVGLPFQAAYCAGKAGLAAFSDALSAEVRDLGIRVVLVEPGNYRTPIDRRRVHAGPGPAYAARLGRALAAIRRDEARGHDPAALAALVVRIAGRRAPRLRYRAGPPVERLAPLARALLPGRLFERILLRRYR